MGVSWDARIYLCLSSTTQRRWGFPGGTVVKNLPANAGDSGNMSSIPGSGRSPAGGKGNPFQYSCLKNSKDRGAWWATVHGVTKDGTQLRTTDTHVLSWFPHDIMYEFSVLYAFAHCIFIFWHVPSLLYLLARFLSWSKIQAALELPMGLFLALCRKSYGLPHLCSHCATYPFLFATSYAGISF